MAICFTLGSILFARNCTTNFSLQAFEIEALGLLQVRQRQAPRSACRNSLATPTSKIKRTGRLGFLHSAAPFPSAKVLGNFCYIPSIHRNSCRIRLPLNAWRSKRVKDRDETRYGEHSRSMPLLRRTAAARSATHGTWLKTVARSVSFGKCACFGRTGVELQVVPSLFGLLLCRGGKCGQMPTLCRQTIFRYPVTRNMSARSSASEAFMRPVNCSGAMETSIFVAASSRGTCALLSLRAASYTR